MGGAFSTGEDNNDLVNILILIGYIKSKKVEWVFRAVDRGDYVVPSHRDLAYKDLSWKLGNIHLSAPCVYCRVMEGLTLKPGLSFLNIGSGTGYLSTMAGLILGRNGTNHGIEMHEDCLMYAYEHLEIFKNKFLDVDSFEFCEPVFQLGNILNVTPNRQYDRVYCGAACPEIHEQYIKQFVKVGGILVMPYKDNLLRIERLDENTWRNRTMLPVSFASLVTPPEDKQRDFLQLPLWQPRSLQELCRSSIRCHLRELVWSEHDDLEYKVPIKGNPINRRLFSEGSSSPNRGQSDSSGDDGEPVLHIAPTFFHVEDHRREVVPSQLVRAVVQPSRGTANGGETSEDSEGGQEEEEESAEPVNLSKQPGNVSEAASVAPMEEEDVFVEAESEERQVRSAVRPLDSKLKRKSEAMEPNSEPHSSQRYRLENDARAENSVENPATTSGGDSVLVEPFGHEDDGEEDDGDDEVVNLAWIEQTFSILKNKYHTEREEDDSESASETSETSSDGIRSDDPAVNWQNRMATESAESDDEDNGSLFVRLIAADAPEKRGDNAAPVNRGTMDDHDDDDDDDDDGDEDAKMAFKFESSSESSGDEETNGKSKYRRGPRSEEKRRSKQQISESSGSDGLADDCNESAEIEEEDEEDEFEFEDPFINLIDQPALKRKRYAHTICREQVSLLMRRKVGSLPLPLPLRLYVNYNREL